MLRSARDNGLDLSARIKHSADEELRACLYDPQQRANHHAARASIAALSSAS